MSCRYALLARLAHGGVRASGADDLGITLSGTPAVERVRAATRTEAPPPPVDARRLRAIKLHEAVPEAQLAGMLTARDVDAPAIEAAVSEPMDVASR